MFAFLDWWARYLRGGGRGDTGSSIRGDIKQVSFVVGKREQIAKFVNQVSITFENQNHIRENLQMTSQELQGLEELDMSVFEWSAAGRYTGSYGVLFIESNGRVDP